MPIARIGLSMRRAHAAEYVEPRDCLAADWAPFLAAALPGVAWMALPNVGPSVIEMVRAWKLEAFVLTGGNDLGAESERDDTEFALLDFAAQGGMPVFGVCRGLQIMHVHQGGTLAPCQGHAGGTHDVRMLLEGRCRTVNSFHGQRLAETATLPEVLALAEDGCVEAAAFPRLRWKGVMWHPERHVEPQREDVDLLRGAFGL